MAGERGFTLIELLVVILIIGILAAIAIPAFIGQRSKGHDADAKSNATNIRIHVESCATEPDATYLDCATAAQIEAGGMPLGTLDLPPFDQYASNHNNGNGNGGGGPKNGAECIVQSNGARACAQTTPDGGSTGTSTGTTTSTTPTETTTSTDDTTATGTTTSTGDTTTSGTGTTETDVETGGTAPDVGDCVEGGQVEPGCVGIVATSSTFTITAVSRSSHVFRIIGSGGRVTRECEPAGNGGCPSSGFW